MLARVGMADRQKPVFGLMAIRIWASDWTVLGISMLAHDN